MSDEVLVVTGGGSGIGRAVVHLAAQRGWRVAVLDLNSAHATAVADEALTLGSERAYAMACDVTSESSVAEAFAETQVALGPLTGLFTSAGIERSSFAHEMSLESWQHVLDTNLTGTFLACREALRSLVASPRRASLVLCSSPASYVAYAAGAASSYSASKGGVSALVRTLAVDYARYGVRVNAVVPGATETPLMWANTDPKDRERMHEVIKTEVPLGRLADPEEPAEAVLWLLSNQSRYVTGSHLVVDGCILAKASISF